MPSSRTTTLWVPPARTITASVNPTCRGRVMVSAPELEAWALSFQPQV